MNARYVVSREAYGEGGYDGLGNPIAGYGPPEPVRVIGWYRPVLDTSTNQPARDDLFKRLTLMAPAGTVGGDRDRWTVDGEKWLQNGDVQDYSKGNPFSMSGAAQAVINLTKIEG